MILQIDRFYRRGDVVCRVGMSVGPQITGFIGARWMLDHGYTNYHRPVGAGVAT